jgi:hypothetical protein
MNAETSALLEPVPPENAPRRFDELVTLWLKLPRMDEAFFAGEILHASNLNTLLGVLVYAGVGTLCIVLETFLRFLLGGGQQASTFGMAVIIGGCFTLIGGPLIFYANTGIYFLSALIFGGKGTFSRQAYVHTLYFVPLSVTSSIATFLQLIPAVGMSLSWLAVVAIMLLDLVFDIGAFKVVHSFSTGRASAAVLLPFFLILGLVCLLVAVIGVLMLMGPAIGNVFSSINQSLVTPTP